MSEAGMDPSSVLASISQLIRMLIMMGNKVKYHRVQWDALLPCLELLLPLLDEAHRQQVYLSESAVQAVFILEQMLQKIKELMEQCDEKASKVHTVIRSHDFTTSLQDTIVEISQALSDFCSASRELPAERQTQVDQCIQLLMKTRCVADISDERLSEEIENIVEQQSVDKAPDEVLRKLFSKLGVTSAETCKREIAELEKLKDQEQDGQVTYLDKVISLLVQIEASLDDNESKRESWGTSIPSDFRCPLSNELMTDPVIVASGQTYERTYIQQWLDQGNTYCPKTRQSLAHKNVIPNYTVKALITNWCEANNFPSPEPAKRPPLATIPNATSSLPVGLSLSSSYSLDHDISRTASICSDTASTVSRSSARSVRTVRAKPFEPGKTDRRRPITCGGNGFQNHHGSPSKYSFSNGREWNSFTENVHQNGIHRRTGSGSSDASSLDDLATAIPEPAPLDISLCLSDASSHYSTDVSGELERYAMLSNGSPAYPENFGSPGRPCDSGSQRKRIHHQRASLTQIVASHQLDSSEADLTSPVVVDTLIEDLQSDCVELQRSAAQQLRMLTKTNRENRVIVANAGAIKPLVSLLGSADPASLENATTALLNLSINDNNKTEIAAAGAIDPLVNVLRIGTAEAKENAAATLFSLSILEENKSTIGTSGAIPLLVQLLANGGLRGKKDAATALFNLSLLSENKSRIVRAGVIKHLVKFMTERGSGMVDKAVAIMANLATSADGRCAIGDEGGIPALVEVVDSGSQRGKENAAAALLHLCTNSNRHRTMVLQEGAIPPLHALSQSGTPRAKEKASALLRHFREQRHGSFGGRIGPDYQRF